MRRYAMFAFWLALGVYFGIAATAGSHVSAAMTLFAGFMAGGAFVAVEGSNG